MDDQDRFHMEQMFLGDTFRAMDDQDRFHMEQMFLGDTFRELELWMIKTDFIWSRCSWGTLSERKAA
jgi:hypothetical protein